MTVIRRRSPTCSNAGMVKLPAVTPPASQPPLTRGACVALRRAATGAALLLSLAAAPALAADGAQLAVDHGCMNCHSSQSQSAPPLKALTDKLVAKGDSPDALQHRLRELRGQTAIHGHQAASDATLLAILQWMAQGAK